MLLRDSTGRSVISIHALLAESDAIVLCITKQCRDFYPRSPCGERPHRIRLEMACRNFYPRSPCGERLIHLRSCNAKPNFYPRSPCGERRLQHRIF